MESMGFHEELEAMATRAGLKLTPAEFIQLSEAWNHVDKMIRRIPRDLRYEDEPGHIFVPCHSND
jgi:hypothetical protein